jgi:hypothetical protein
MRQTDAEMKAKAEAEAKAAANAADDFGADADDDADDDEMQIDPAPARTTAKKRPHTEGTITADHTGKAR